MDGETRSIQTVPINGPEDLRKITRASDIEIVQLRPGKLQGSIMHFGIGNLEVSVGQFNSAIRLRGSLNPERIAIGIILDSAGRITEWWKDVQPGDVGVFPARVELDEIHEGGAAYLAASITLPELLSMLGGQERLEDPRFWNRKSLWRPDLRVGEEIRRQLRGIVSDVERKVTAPSAQAADFFQRTIIEAFVVSLTSALPPERGRACSTGARLVREAEDYVDAADGRPVHISELCSALRVSRRNLHRAFADALDMGPVAYLRRRRLSAIHSVLKRSDPATISIADLAFEYGFPEPSRFSALYRAHFGERPSETCRSAS
jgi:AraC family ethanolamine operon transcriptional activator